MTTPTPAPTAPSGSPPHAGAPNGVPRPAPAAEPREAVREDDPALFDLFRPQPDEPPRIRQLRWIVTALGVVLIAMFVAVIGRVAYLMMRSGPSEPAITSATGPSEAAPTVRALAPDVALSLPTGARIKAHALAGRHLTVHYDGPAGEGILVLDLEAGRAVSHVRVGGPR